MRSVPHAIAFVAIISLVSPISSSADIAAGYDPAHLEVKFGDDLPIRIGAQGAPEDPSGRSLSSSAARALLEELQADEARWRPESGGDPDVLDRMRDAAEARLGRPIGDLNNYYVLAVPSGWDPELLLDRLNGLADVEYAAPLPLAMPAPTPGSVVSLQGYLTPATDGIDADYAWGAPGGAAPNVTIVDLEYSWNLNHEDLPPGVATWIPQGMSASDPFANDNHGTAVLGVVGSLPNGWGTTGAAYDAGLAVAPVYLNNSWSVQTALTYAITLLSAGDIVLLEQQIAGPNWPGGSSQLGMVPVEWSQSIYDAIVTAVGNGIHVVEAAGNGSQDLDDRVYRRQNGGHWPFLQQNDSGAIIAGAGAAPAAYGGSDTDRSRLPASNFGSRVNVQGWGQRVTTTGYGGLYSAEGSDLYYTDNFNGTSAASAVVAAAVALLESNHEIETGTPMDPEQMRDLLVSTGSPQQAGSVPITQQIGPRPDVKSAYCVGDVAVPAITCPADITVQAPAGRNRVSANHPEIAAFLDGASAVDLCDNAPAIDTDAPNNFPLGETAVTFTATDTNGNEAQCTAIVDVVGGPPDVDSEPTAVSSSAPGAALHQLRPNPFSRFTRFEYAVEGGSGRQVRIEVYSADGRRVRELVSGFRLPGRYEEQWDGRGDDGRLLAGGVYFYRARIGAEQIVRRLSILR